MGAELKITIKSKCPGSLTLRAGHGNHEAIALPKAGDEHVFDTEGQFLPYRESCANLKDHLDVIVEGQPAPAAPATPAEQRKVEQLKAAAKAEEFVPPPAVQAEAQAEAAASSARVKGKKKAE